jgi:hypothetical protein
MNIDLKEKIAISLILIGFPGCIIPGMIIGQELGLVIIFLGVFLPCLIIQFWSIFDDDMRDWQNWGHDYIMEEHLKTLDKKAELISQSSIKSEFKQESEKP